MNRIDQLLSLGFKVQTGHIEFYRLELSDLYIDVYTSYETFGFRDVQLRTVTEDGDFCYTSLPNVKTLSDLKTLIDLL